MANPLMAFLSMFVPCKSKRTVSLLVSLGYLATIYILATALHSPTQLWGDVGGAITVVAWVVVGGLFSYVKVGLVYNIPVLSYLGEVCSYHGVINDPRLIL